MHTHVRRTHTLCARAEHLPDLHFVHCLDMQQRPRVVTQRKSEILVVFFLRFSKPTCLLVHPCTNPPVDTDAVKSLLDHILMSEFQRVTN